MSLSQNLNRYLATKGGDAQAAQGSASQAHPPASQGPQGQPPSNPPLGTATGLAETWDNLTVTPFTVQPEHSIHRSHKGKSAAA